MEIFEDKVSTDWALGSKVTFLFSVGGTVKLKMEAVGPGDVGQLLHLCCITFKQCLSCFRS